MLDKADEIGWVIRFNVWMSLRSKVSLLIIEEVELKTTLQNIEILQRVLVR